MNDTLTDTLASSLAAHTQGEISGERAERVAQQLARDIRESPEWQAMNRVAEAAREFNACDAGPAAARDRVTSLVTMCAGVSELDRLRGAQPV